MKKIRFIIVGFGFMGQTHAATICAHPGMELAAVVTRRPKAQVKPAGGNVQTARMDWALLDTIPFFPTMEEAFANVEADAVLIATPTALHAENIVAAVKAGKHVFVEKPMCLNMTEVEKIRAALKTTDKFFQVGFVVRYSSTYKFLTQAVRENKYGKLQFLDLLRATGFPAWGDWSDPAAAAKFGGAVLDLNIHDMDFALQLCGDPVQVIMDPLYARHFVTTRLNSSWEFPKGELVRIQGGFLMPSTYPFRAGFTAEFEKATLEYSTSDGQLKCHTAEGSQVISLEDCNAYRDELVDFVNCILNGTRPEADFESGAKTIYWYSQLNEKINA